MKSQSSRIMLFVLIEVVFLFVYFVYAETAEEYCKGGNNNVRS